MGGETGAQMITAAMRQVVLYGLPALSFLFMVWMPAALQLTFTTGTTIGVIQSLLFKSNAARRWLRITPLVKPEATTKTNTIIERTSQTLNGGVKAVMESTGFGKVMDKGKDQQINKEERSRAQSYESRRQKEIASERRAERSRRRR